VDYENPTEIAPEIYGLEYLQGPETNTAIKSAD
jgi:hypothetical protein